MKFISHQPIREGLILEYCEQWAHKLYPPLPYIWWKTTKSKHPYHPQKLFKIKLLTTCTSSLCNLTIDQVLLKCFRTLRRSCGQRIDPYYWWKTTKSKHPYHPQKLFKIKLLATCTSPLYNLTMYQVLSKSCMSFRRSCGQSISDRQTDGQTDRQTGWNLYTPPKLRLRGV